MSIKYTGADGGYGCQSDANRAEIAERMLIELEKVVPGDVRSRVPKPDEAKVGHKGGHNKKRVK